MRRNARNFVVIAATAALMALAAASSAAAFSIGVTNFNVNAEGDQAKRVKVELPQGLNVNPQAVPQCPVETFKTNEAACAASKVGTSEVTTKLELVVLEPPITLSFPV